MMPGMGSGGGPGGMGGMPGAAGMSGSRDMDMLGGGMGAAGYAPAAPEQPADGRKNAGVADQPLQAQNGVTGQTVAGASAAAAGSQLVPLDAEGKPQTEAAGQTLGDVTVESVPDLSTVILRGSRPDVSRVAAQVAKYWALQGLRGLSIQIDQSDARQVGDGSDDRTQAALEFRSLGTDPELDITVYQQSRMTWLAWTAVLVILVAGLMQTHARCARACAGSFCSLCWPVDCRSSAAR